MTQGSFVWPVRHCCVFHFFLTETHRRVARRIHVQNQWSAIQHISLVSGNFTGAVQQGRIAYDFVNRRTREDQVLVRAPIRKNATLMSNNMTEWFDGTKWYFMDWTTNECQEANFGIGMVKPDWLLSDDEFPRKNGSTFIYSLDDDGKERDFVNTSWIWVDGSIGFGEKPLSSIFEWYVDKDNRGRRLRMPSTLSSDLMVDLQNFQLELDDSWFDIPQECFNSSGSSSSIRRDLGERTTSSNNGFVMSKLSRNFS